MGVAVARKLERLSARKAGTERRPGYYADGNGLYLQVAGSGARSWIFRFTLNGRSREMGLGSAQTFSLKAARDKAQACRQLLHDGIDPIEDRHAKRAEARLAAAHAMTFSACASAYIAAHRSGWRNPKHAGQWESTLRTYAEPVLGGWPVQAIDTALVMRVVEPIWEAKTETASRLRGRIEAVLDWATVRGFRKGDNPARWRGHLDHLLPERGKVRKVVHHAALAYDNMATFMAALRQEDGIAPLGLQLLILTAARTGEVVGARWSEFDEAKRLWIVPSSRMKAGREHRVALSSAACAVLSRLRALFQSDYVLPGLRHGRPLSNMAFLALLKRMGRADLTAHGFRSSFRDWAAERTAYPREVVEMALAHTIADKVEAAYRRGDLFQKRLLLMEAWARHCGFTAADDTDQVSLPAAAE
jgi:integrase